MKKVLFVCTANICRSPAAAAIFDTLAGDRGMDARAERAGVAALEGRAIAPRNVLAGCDPERIFRAAELVTETDFYWSVPDGYLDPNVSDKVLRYVLGNVGRRPMLNDD